MKTCLLFAGLKANGTTPVHESVHTRDHGELALRAFGAKLKRSTRPVSIQRRSAAPGHGCRVPGDISSAAFFLCAAALFPESGLLLDNLGLNPTRATLLDVLRDARGQVPRSPELERAQWRAGRHGAVRRAERRAAGRHDIRRAGGATYRRVAGAGSDRSLYAERHPHPRCAGIAREGIRPHRAGGRKSARAWEPRSRNSKMEWMCPAGQALHGAEIDSGDDHRIAMAFSVAALRAEGETDDSWRGIGSISRSLSSSISCRSAYRAVEPQGGGNVLRVVPAYCAWFAAAVRSCGCAGIGGGGVRPAASATAPRARADLHRGFFGAGSRPGMVICCVMLPETASATLMLYLVRVLATDLLQRCAVLRIGGHRGGSGIFRAASRFRVLLQHQLAVVDAP